MYKCLGSKNKYSIFFQASFDWMVRDGLTSRYEYYTCGRDMKLTKNNRLVGGFEFCSTAECSIMN